MSVMDKAMDRVSFWRHPVSYLYQVLLVTLIGGRPVVVNVTIDRPVYLEKPEGPLMYWPRRGKRHVVYNINLYPTRSYPQYPHNPLITSNPQ